MSKLFDYFARVEERRGEPIPAFDRPGRLHWKLRRAREDIAVLVRVAKSLSRDCAKYVYGRKAIERAEALLPKEKP